EPRVRERLGMDAVAIKGLVDPDRREPALHRADPELPVLVADEAGVLAMPPHLLPQAPPHDRAGAGEPLTDEDVLGPLDPVLPDVLASAEELEERERAVRLGTALERPHGLLEEARRQAIVGVHRDEEVPARRPEAGVARGGGARVPRLPED